ncbi:MAG: RecQ family ATP-dependent DNA helicase, partial [Verrucomicrobiaceae bacterium]|nr:RecQ family ATP-dependent DNA helicase [Verrucomicrobiaceae bacterium]
MNTDEGTDPGHQLEKHFGFTAFRAGQGEVIESLLAGRPALAIFPTGGGKSLCYQLPAILLEGITLVVSPLIALMKDQVDGLVSRGISAARLDSSLSAEEVHSIYARMGAGQLKILFIAPERLANENFRRRLAGCRISLLAIDEAHCISEWGHNFRPDYLKLAGFANELSITRILALTATATPLVATDIRKSFGISERDHHQLSFRRPNLSLRVIPCQEEEKRDLLLARLQVDPTLPSIIYATRQETAESLAAFLKRAGLSARPYHAGLRDETRMACQEAFMSGEAPIITATIAFGMGIDKANIRRIIHYNLPKSLENYTQETGRAGRD